MAVLLIFSLRGREPLPGDGDESRGRVGVGANGDRCGQRFPFSRGDPDPRWVGTPGQRPQVILRHRRFRWFRWFH